jgi:glycosyltransferase involved in cell wall biosynthesis
MEDLSMSTTSQKPTQVKVSVAMITYNHEAFIGQAIESVLMQQTDFEFELVIGEDCSTDKTREIVADYARRYPKRIRALLHEHNLGKLGKNNATAVINACRGDYIAWLEGDDYWTDPLKLQLQVDFLESHRECAICFHNAEKVFEGGGQEPSLYCSPDMPAVTGLEDLLEYDYIPTASIMYRRGQIGELPSWFLDLQVGDWPSHILRAQYGDVCYINRVMSVYRIHSRGMWNGKTYIDRLLVNIQVYESLYNYLPRRYIPTLKRHLIRHYGLLAWAYAEMGSIAEGRAYVHRCLSFSPQSILRRDILGVALRLFCPTLYRQAQNARGIQCSNGKI